MKRSFKAIAALILVLALMTGWTATASLTANALPNDMVVDNPELNINDGDENEEEKKSGWLEDNKTLIIMTGAVLFIIIICGAAVLYLRSKATRTGDAKPDRNTSRPSGVAAGSPIEPRITQVRTTSVHNIGRRKNQEDSFGISAIDDQELCREKGVMAVVADGMGGLEGGEEISSASVTHMLQGFSDKNVGSTGSQELARLLNITVQRINDLLERTIGLGRAGSTLMAVIIHNMSLSWISVGDSRTALYRNGKLTDLNRKHNYASELEEKVKQGRITQEQAQTHPDRDKLTSYVGMGKLKYVDYSTRALPLYPGDRIIMMSDGIFNTLSDAEIEQILALPFDQISLYMESAVLQKNSPWQDNFTAVVIEIPAG